MAEEDEIDIIGDFSFNSCFAQNSQGIPSCSDREDTVHPQWFLDSTANNWYDVDDKRSNRRNEGPSRKLSGNNAKNKPDNVQTVWSPIEKEVLMKQMATYGRDIDKISKTLRSKSKAEIQALIEAEHGITLDTPPQGLSQQGKSDELDNVPPVIQEEIIADVGTPIVNMIEVIGMVTTGVPTIPVVKHNKKMSLSNTTDCPESVLMVNPSEILYEDELIVASTELITPEKVDVIKKVRKKVKGKVERKMGNHRRKGTDKSNARLKYKEIIRSPPGRQRKDSSLSDDSTKNPKMHIVFSSGQALPVSEGEEVIKIEKKKESEGESDIEVDVDSDNEDNSTKKTVVEDRKVELGKDDKNVAIRKFEPMPKRNKKINLGGSGGYTIMHTESGDMYEVREEPRKEKPSKKSAIQLYPCRFYNADKPAPFTVQMHVSCLIAMDAHAHASRAEVAGLVGGDWREPRLLLRTYARVRAASRRTHCDCDPVSQAAAAERLRLEGAAVCGWHHSHPSFAAAPSATDLRSQRALQALPSAAPAVALLTSQHWPVGRAASVYRCFRVEDTDPETDIPVGWGLRVSLVADVTRASLGPQLRSLAELLREHAREDPHAVRATDVCPQAGLTYLDKLISSVRHHVRSAGYADDDEVIALLIKGIRDVFR